MDTPMVSNPKFYLNQASSKGSATFTTMEYFDAEVLVFVDNIQDIPNFISRFAKFQKYQPSNLITREKHRRNLNELDYFGMVPGVGIKKAEALQKRFGSVQQLIKSAIVGQRLKELPNELRAMFE